MPGAEDRRGHRGAHRAESDPSHAGHRPSAHPIARSVIEPRHTALTVPSFRAATTEAQLTELVKNISPLVTKDKPSTNQKSISVSTADGKIAVFVYKMTAAAGGPIYFKTQIRDEDDRWQVMSFRSSLSPISTDVE